MSRTVLAVGFTVLVLLLVGVGAGFARAAVAGLDPASIVSYVPAPSFLGPINELGRNGWDCVPERAAKASHLREAELPSADGN